MSGKRSARLAAVALVAMTASAAPIAQHAYADPSLPSRATAPQPAAPSAATTAYVPVVPCRLLDTRVDNGGAQLLPAVAIAVATSGRCDLPAGTAALAVSVTVTQPLDAGFLTVWPGGAAQPATSTLNFAPGETRANGAIVAIGADGTLGVSSSADAHVVIDVTGAFTPTDRARAGRFVPLLPKRVLDTREGAGRLAPGGTVTVPLPIGVPADATALAATITTTEATGPGYFSVFPAGATPPDASSLNTDAPAQTRGTGLIVPVDAGGFTVFSQSGEHLIIDITGWFTGPSAAESPNGLFVPSLPTRLVDTRTGQPLYPSGTIEVDASSITGGPVAALAANWTMADTWSAGFVTVHPARTERPLTSTTTSDVRGQNISQFGIATTSDAGAAVYANAGTDLVVDVTGWFLGYAKAPSLAEAAPNTAVSDTERRVLLMGDSTLAGIRWYTNSQHALGGSNFTLDAESCRRLIGSSCYGREKRTAPNAITAINSHDGPFDTVVVMTGYNDWSGRFSEAFDLTVEAARAKGADEILWLTYREGTAYRNPDGGTKQDQGFRQQNQILRDKVASGAYPDVRILDYNTYTAPTTGWFTRDGVHFTLAGAYGTADYISRQIAFSHQEPCPAPWAPGEAIESPCSDPDAYPGAVDPLTLYEGNPNDVHCYEVGSDHHVNCRVDPKLGH